MRAAVLPAPVVGFRSVSKKMIQLDSQLQLDRCPHCNVDSPNISVKHWVDTANYQGSNARRWGIYVYRRCGGIVTASANSGYRGVIQIFPDSTKVDENIPTKAKSYLQQAINSLHSPAGAIMLSASTVDAMLKDKGYKKGNLYSRIDKAATDHLITKEMAIWAHQVRLEANEQRHADEEAELPDENDAKKTIDFTLALAEFLFVLPSKVERGLKETEDGDDDTKAKKVSVNTESPK